MDLAAILLIPPVLDFMALLVVLYWVRNAADGSPGWRSGWRNSPVFLRMAVIGQWLIFISTSCAAVLAITRMAHGTLPELVFTALVLGALVLPSILSVGWVFVWALRIGVPSRDEEVESAILLLDQLGYRIEAPGAPA